MEVEADNPFGPVCDCYSCLKELRKVNPYCTDYAQHCFDDKQRKKKSKKSRSKSLPPPCQRQSDFKLYWKAGIPCEQCQRFDCNHRFLNSNCCRQCWQHAKGK